MIICYYNSRKLTQHGKVMREFYCKEPEEDFRPFPNGSLTSLCSQWSCLYLWAYTWMFWVFLFSGTKLRFVVSCSSLLWGLGCGLGKAVPWTPDPRPTYQSNCFHERFLRGLYRTLGKKKPEQSQACCHLKKINLMKSLQVSFLLFFFSNPIPWPVIFCPF